MSDSNCQDEDDKTGDDALQELLDEADNLMQDLDINIEEVETGDDTADGSPSIVIDGFAIDSDEEGEETNKKQAAGTPADVDIDVDIDHPLSEEWLTAPASGPAAVPSHPQLQSQSQSQLQPPVGPTEQASSAATMDSLKGLQQQTTWFASNLANMAQRAAHQVVAATAPPPLSQVHGASPSSAPAVHTSMPHSMQQQQQQQQQQQPSSIPVKPPMKSNVELDKDQKQKMLQEHIGDLLPGESIIMFLSNLLHVSDTCGVSYTASTSSDNGMWCCAMSYFRLILFNTSSTNYNYEHEQEIEHGSPIPAEWNASCWPSTPNSTKFLQIPLASMDRVEKTVYQANGSSYMGLVICAKDCGRITRFTTPSYADTGRAYDSLNTYAFPGRRNLGYLFAFESKRQTVMASVKVDEATGQQTITISPTRKRFDAMIEFPRLLAKTTTTQSPWILWASLNSTYQLSPTYPSVMVGPATLDETKPDVQAIVKQCAAFRSEQRLPSLTWCGTGGASIWRSSQPKIGLQGNRSAADELFLRHVVESARSANAMAEPPPIYSRTILQQLTGDYTKDWTPESGCGMKILDLRPRSAAMANRTGGYGYENTSNYSNTTLQFCNIGNIHAIRDSYQKLCTVCNSDATADIQWNSLVEDTKWLSHIRIILAAAWETAYWVHVWRMPILVHCSHGWDRTSQVCALAQLLLDPYYRTVEGFSCLVEKDFMSFGHPFHTRCAHGEGRGTDSSNSTSVDEGQISPIFLQFLDCTYQIVQLYPECFEFTTAYLLELSFQVYSCRFGSLLCDTERERELLAGIRQRTYSVWDYLDDRHDLRNSHYTNTEGVLLMPLPTLMRNVSLWVDRHCCYGPKPTRRKAVLDASC